MAADFDNRDVLSMAKQDNMCITVIVRIRNGRINSREKISINIGGESDADIVESVITQFYLDSDFIPKTINVAKNPTNKKQLLVWLTEKTKRPCSYSSSKKRRKSSRDKIGSAKRKAVARGVDNQSQETSRIDTKNGATASGRSTTKDSTAPYRGI